VHVNGIRLLALGNVADPDAVLKGLRDVRARFTEA
jgi:hypothetical protein